MHELRFKVLWGIWLWVGWVCNMSAIVEKTSAGQDWKESPSHLIQRPKKFVSPLKAHLLEHCSRYGVRPLMGFCTLPDQAGTRELNFMLSPQGTGECRCVLIASQCPLPQIKHNKNRNTLNRLQSPKRLVKWEYKCPMNLHTSDLY